MTESKIVIEVNQETNIVTVMTGDKTHTFESVVLFCGDAKNKGLLIKMFGASSDAAWAYGQGFIMAQNNKKSALSNFYKQCAAHVVQIIDPLIFQNKTTIDDIIDKQESVVEEKKKWN